MTENLLNKLNLLIQDDDTQAGFELKKELIEKIRTSSNPREKSEYEGLLLKLDCYLLPWINSLQFQTLLRNNLAIILQINPALKENINQRIIAFPEESQDIIRLEMISILIKNKEVIGQKTIENWLIIYNKLANNKKVTALEKKDLIERSEYFDTLTNKEKQLLIRLFDLYDFLKPDYDFAEDLKEIAKKISSATKKESDINSQSTITTEENLERISLSEVLAKYPTAVDQLVTSAPIRIRGGQDMLRPTIKNWLADYTYSVGYDAHSSIVRGNYLFQSENTKNLNAQDRQRLSYILKSYDEKTPVAVDKTKKQIVFPSPENISRPASSPELSHANVSASRLDLHQNLENPEIEKPAPPKPLERNYEHYQIPQRKTENLEAEASNDNLHNIREARFGSSEFSPKNFPEKPHEQRLTFSSPQKLPFEKEREERFSISSRPAVPSPVLQANKTPKIEKTPERKEFLPKHQPSFSRPAAPTPPSRPQMTEVAPKPTALENILTPFDPMPLHIRPASHHHDAENSSPKEELPKNVVNLKDNF